MGGKAMGVQLTLLRFSERGWSATFRVDYGVYHLPSYRVRLLGAGYTEDPEVQAMLEAFLTGLVLEHARSGSLPPTGEVIPASQREAWPRLTRNEALQQIGEILQRRLPDVTAPFGAL